jgi:hypothetical protein
MDCNEQHEREVRLKLKRLRSDTKYASKVRDTKTDEEEMGSEHTTFQQNY